MSVLSAAPMMKMQLVSDIALRRSPTRRDGSRKNSDIEIAISS